MKLYCKDSKLLAEDLEPNSVHAVVTEGYIFIDFHRFSMYMSIKVGIMFL